jgi:hypothetical protein
VNLIYLVIGIFLLIAAVRFFTDVAKKMTQNKALRMEMFETIGTAWITAVNKHIPNNPCHRNPHKDILEKSFKKKGAWVISFPVARNANPNDDFELFITISFVDPYSQVSTTLLGLLLSKRVGPWWVKKSKIPTLEHVTKKLQNLVLVFNAIKSADQ